MPAVQNTERLLVLAVSVEEEEEEAAGTSPVAVLFFFSASAAALSRFKCSLMSFTRSEDMASMPISAIRVTPAPLTDSDSDDDTDDAEDEKGGGFTARINSASHCRRPSSSRNGHEGDEGLSSRSFSFASRLYEKPRPMWQWESNNGPTVVWKGW